MGGIIYVCGFDGAGKSTLIRTALDQFPALNYLVTYVTRPPRFSELDGKSFEYRFVSLEEYNALRATSTQWDHTEVNGYFYGANPETVNQAIDSGQWFIVVVTGEVTKIEEMQQFYHGVHPLIWIDTPLELCNQRIRMRDGEEAAERKIHSPIQVAEQAGIMRAYADFVFQPTGVLADDQQTFSQLVATISNIS